MREERGSKAEQRNAAAERRNVTADHNLTRANLRKQEGAREN